MVSAFLAESLNAEIPRSTKSSLEFYYSQLFPKRAREQPSLRTVASRVRDRQLVGAASAVASHEILEAGARGSPGPPEFVLNVVLFPGRR